MKLSGLSVIQFLAIRQLEIRAGKIVYLTGENESGKTSVIKAVQAILEGENDPRVIHDGADRAELLMQLDDGTSIRRVIGESGSRLTVEDKKGDQIRKPQAFLKSLVGSLAFNPIKFFEAKEKERKKYLLRAINVELSRERIMEWCGEVPPIDLDRHGLEVLTDLTAHYFEQRRQIHQRATDNEGGAKELAQKIPPEFDAPAARALNTQDIAKIISEDEAAQASRREKESALAGAKERLASQAAEVEQLEMRIAKAREAREEAEKYVAEAQAGLVSVTGPDAAAVSEARALLAEYDETKERLHEYDTMQKFKTEEKRWRERHKTLDELVTFLQEDAPKQLLDKMPKGFRGLSLDGDILVKDGFPLDSLSTGIQIKFAVEVARQLAGKLRLICVDGLERLDPTARAAFIEECGDDRFQYIITEVRKGKLRVKADIAPKPA